MIRTKQAHDRLVRAAGLAPVVHSHMFSWQVARRVPALIAVLGGRGFAIREGAPPDAFVLADGAGREVDVHAVVFDSAGNGVHKMANGQEWIYPAEGYAGTLRR